MLQDLDAHTQRLSVDVAWLKSFCFPQLYYRHSPLSHNPRNWNHGTTSRSLCRSFRQLLWFCKVDKWLLLFSLIWEHHKNNQILFLSFHICKQAAPNMKRTFTMLCWWLWWYYLPKKQTNKKNTDLNSLAGIITFKNILSAVAVFGVLLPALQKCFC